MARTVGIRYPRGGRTITSELYNGYDDFEVVTVNKFDGVPKPLYFFPVITFIVLFYFNRVEISLNAGYVSAILGTSIVSALIVSGLIGFGFITGEWYYLTSKSKSIIGDFLIAVLGLFSTTLLFFVLGYVENFLPAYDEFLWFFFGFIVYEIMWRNFLWYYNENPLKYPRFSIFTGVVVSVGLGIVPIYFAIAVGWM